MSFNPHNGSNQKVATGAVSASVTIDAQDLAVRLVNAGASLIHVRIGESPQTATAADTPVADGDSVVLRKSYGDNCLAYISPDGAGVLNVETGTIVE